MEFVVNNNEIKYLNIEDLLLLNNCKLAHKGNLYSVFEHENGSKYTVQIQEINKATNKAIVLVNQQLYKISWENKGEKFLNSLGIVLPKKEIQNNLVAPMPGLVLDILVKVGDEIEENSPLLILEAMKMENLLKSSAKGTVKSIKVQNKQAVEKGVVLIEFE